MRIPSTRPSANQRLHLDVGGVEDRAVLLAQPGQRGDREEPPVAAHAVAPADQPVVLTVVHLGAGPVTRCPARSASTRSPSRSTSPSTARSRRRRRNPTAATRFGRRPASSRCRRTRRTASRGRVSARPTTTGSARAVSTPTWLGTMSTIRPMPRDARRRRKPRQTVGAAQFRRHGRRVGDVVAVRGARAPRSGSATGTGATPRARRGSPAGSRRRRR